MKSIFIICVCFCFLAKEKMIEICQFYVEIRQRADVTRTQVFMGKNHEFPLLRNLSSSLQANLYPYFQ